MGDEQKTTGAQNERGFETGMDELWKFIMGMVAGNIKRTYDEYQDLSLKVARDLHEAGMASVRDAHTVVMRMFKNAETIDHANDIRAMGHGELAMDRMWNVDEVAELVAQTSTFKDAIAAGVTAGVDAVFKQAAAAKANAGTTATAAKPA